MCVCVCIYMCVCYLHDAFSFHNVITRTSLVQLTKKPK